MIPPKLKKGDNVRVIAPAHSITEKLTDKLKQRGIERLESLGLRVSFGKYVEEQNDFKTTSVEHRLEDLHDAYSDPDVQLILPANGGSSANQLLKHIDYDLIKRNPKILCGLSDITALSYAIYTKTGIVNYYGPHFTMLGAGKLADYSLESMRHCFFSDEPYEIKPVEKYCNSEWDREVILNEGFWTINEGEAEGTSIGGNFLTTNLTLGSEFAPELSDRILFLEENKVIDFRGVQNELQAILNQPGCDKIRGLIIGHFQRQTKMTRELLTKIIKSKKELKDVPVIGNVDFGHIVPISTLPIGGSIRFKAGANDDVKIKVIEH